MPTVQHLLHASLEPTRHAILEVSPGREPHRWVVLHLILGTALRLRAPSLPADERSDVYVESLQAFEAALAECCERKKARDQQHSSGGTNQFSLHTNACVSGPDGVQMVMDATTVSIPEGIEKLERAIRVFTEHSGMADRHTELRTWVIARSNLGCALTMLGKRTYGLNGVLHIERAVDVLRDAVAACLGDELLDERASLNVNLSDAFQALADRAMPGERLRYIEQSLDWMAQALGYFAPEEYRWLLDLDGGAFA